MDGGGAGVWGEAGGAGVEGGAEGVGLNARGAVICHLCCVIFVTSILCRW